MKPKQDLIVGGRAVIAVILLSATTMFAQDTSLSAYTFAGVGAATSTFNRSTTLFHVGGGAELTNAKGLGVGTEFGYLGPWSNGSNGVGLYSLNALYRFAHDSEVQPFVTGGYSLGFRSQTAHFVNVAGGATAWFRPGMGVRIEFRDNIRDPSTHWLILRVGLAFR